MKESDFISHNKSRWAEIERNLHRKAERKNADWGIIYQKLVDDLSYAQTHYPRRSVTQYLNKLTIKVFSLLYRNKKPFSKSLKQFWFRQVPSVMYHVRFEMLLSLAVFLLSMAIGVVSLIYQPEFAKEILGEGYISMTEKNIEEGNPMGVYKRQNAFEMFYGIFLNNILVAARTYIMGIFMGIGTMGILVFNGIMVGVFQFYFLEHGLLYDTFLTIWQHGSIEIPSIVIAGGAGFVLARGLLFPQTYTRLVALRRSFMLSARIFLALTPFFLYAAFIESYVTRYDNLPNGLRLFFILFSFSLIVGYFFVLPWYLKRAGKLEPIQPEDEEPESPKPELEKIQSSPGVLSLAFWTVRNNLGPFLSAGFKTSIVLALLVWFLLTEFETNELYTYFEGNLFTSFALPEYVALVIGKFGVFLRLFRFSDVPESFALMSILLGYAAFQIGNIVHGFSFHFLERRNLNLLLYNIMLMAFGLAPFFMGMWYVPFWLIIVLPFLLVHAGTHASGEKSPTGFQVLGNQPHRIFFLTLIFTLTSVLFLMLMQSSILYILMDLMNSITGFSEAGGSWFFEFMILWSWCFTFTVMFMFFVLGYRLAWFSFREILNAPSLKNRVDNWINAKPLNR